MKQIEIKGAKQNNLQINHLKIPLGSFTVLCGPSGSGKSSLAFETLFAGGQRYYTQTLSNYARQYIQELPKPLVDQMENIPPTLALEQKNSIRSSRPTVATLTDLAECFRVLFSSAGVPFCPKDQLPLQAYSPKQGAQKILENFKGQKGMLLVPLEEQAISEKKTSLKTTLLQDGFSRICWWDKRTKTNFPVIRELRLLASLPKKNFYLVLDRLLFKEEARLIDSLRLANQIYLKYNNQKFTGYVKVVSLNGGILHLGEQKLCPLCGYTFPFPLQPSLFNFNSSLGACPDCKGFGSCLAIDEKKVVLYPKKSLAQGAIHPFTTPSTSMERRQLKQFCKVKKIDLHRPWEKLSSTHKKMIWEGSGSFWGVKGFFDYLETKKYKFHIRILLSRYKNSFLCLNCEGTRFQKAVSYVFFHGKNLPDLFSMDVSSLIEFFQQKKLEQNKKLASVIEKIMLLLRRLRHIGLDYLGLDRLVKTLSSGEFQRLNLVHQLGLGLSQVLYVLDEPTVGLHPKDTVQLIELLKGINRLGNTLIVVEHDPEVIKAASFIVELGPQSGVYGGKIVFAGSKDHFLKASSSQTSAYLTDKKINKRLFPAKEIKQKSHRYVLEISGCKGYNLKNVHLRVPLNRLVTVTGVSGSGKSTLVTRTLYPALARAFGKKVISGLPFSEIKGIEHLKKVIFVDPSPVERIKRSMPVTYLKFYDSIRQLLSEESERKKLHTVIRPGSFSLHVEGGRCFHCRGLGYQEIEMVFMDPVKIPCEECGGKRFKKEILDLKWRGKNIDQILNLTVEKALEFFVSFPSIYQPLFLLKKVGLEYLVLGQSLSTLSGGESQRLKLAREFLDHHSQAILYILDEPTLGLHFREVRLLLKLLRDLVEKGNSVLLIEHNLEVIRHSDYLIDIGPLAGSKGGEILIQGSPTDLANSSLGFTGSFLKKFLKEKELKFS